MLRKGGSKMTIPVVLISKTLRQSLQLEFVIKQAETKNKEVFLIGDEGNKQFCPNNHRYISEYDEGVVEFEGLYQHLSTNPEDIERFCFSRWFVLRNFLRTNKYEGAFYIDDDILLFADATAEFENYKHLYCTLSGKSSGHSSYWSLEGLEAFCEYLMEVYSDKNSYEFERLSSHYYTRQKFGLNGGLCDMTLLESFGRYKYPHLVGEVSIASLFELYYDHVIHESAGFEHKNGLKWVTFKNGVPYCSHLKLGVHIPFATIHFQGNHKNLIEIYYKDCNDSLISHK